jgi:hypothetical protein
MKVRLQMLHTPTARRDRLIVRELENETLVYDEGRDEAHCLNQTAALVWKHCDGRTTADEIAIRIGVELQETVDPKVVWLALAQLRRKRLLERVPRVETRSIRLVNVGRPRISRRELALRLGQAMVVALPLITTIGAPRPASAASCSPSCDDPLGTECCPLGCLCSRSAACCSGLCSGGVCV